MRSLFEDFGPNALDFLITVADYYGLTRISPASITYRRGRGGTYDPDTGVTETWAEEVTISDALVGHYKISEIMAAAGDLKLEDVVAIFAQSELSGEPQPGDEMEISGKTYHYVSHQAALGLYFVGGRIPERPGVKTKMM